MDDDGAVPLVARGSVGGTFFAAAGLASAASSSSTSTLARFRGDSGGDDVAYAACSSASA